MKMHTQSWRMQILFALLFEESFGSILSLRSPHLQRRHEDHENPIIAPQPLQYVVEKLEPSYPAKYHSKRVKVSYPAVEVPSMMENDGMAVFDDLSTFLPCKDCLILEMSSDIEYEDHSPADADTGMWLHHTVFVNRGRKDTFCGQRSWGQRFYASGNEKTIIDMSAHG